MIEFQVCLADNNVDLICTSRWLGLWVASYDFCNPFFSCLVMEHFPCPMSELFGGEFYVVGVCVSVYKTSSMVLCSIIIEPRFLIETDSRWTWTSSLNCFWLSISSAGYTSDNEGGGYKDGVGEARGGWVKSVNGRFRRIIVLETRGRW
jgi:hypothetical protein